MAKVPGITFYPLNTNTLPTPTPFSTKETFPSCAVRFQEFFNVNLSQHEVQVYYKVKCSVPVMELHHQVFKFIQDKCVWMNNKQIDNSRPIDAALIYGAHKNWSNKHVIYNKIKKAMKKLDTEQAVNEDQQVVLTELLQENTFGWTIQSKRHTFTDWHHPRVHTNGVVIVCLKPFLRKAREIFGLIQVRYPDILGGGMRIIPTGIGDTHGYEAYKQMMMRNNDYHNRTDCVTIQGYHPEHRDLLITWDNMPSKKTYKHLREINGVFDIVETNKSATIGKYFAICDRSKRHEIERIIHAIMKALVGRIQDESDYNAQKYFGEHPSLRTQLSYGGYSAEAAELDKDIFSTFSSRPSQSTFAHMTLNFGTNDMTDEFPALRPPALPANPWKQNTTENQLAVRGEERSTVSMTDASYAASLASIQTDMASLLSGTIATIQADNAKERRAYEERETNRENQWQEREAARETQGHTGTERKL